jgi:hypothetical protein
MGWFLRKPLLHFDQRNPRGFDSAMGIPHSCQKLAPLDVEEWIVALLPYPNFLG